MSETPDFARQLADWVEGYEGPRQRAIRHSGEVFRFYTRLFANAGLSRHHRHVVNAVLSYFVVSDDVFPEHTLGPLGLVDDLFVASHAYRMLAREVSANLLLEAWSGPGELHEVMDLIHRESRATVGKQAREVLRLAGLA